jgi:hypothetical protein
MESQRFDTLARTLGESASRRRLLRFSALPLVGGLATFLIDDNESAAKNKKKKHKKKKCPPKEKVCAGKCGTVTYKCKGKTKTVDCGACRCDVCASGCPFTSVQAAIDAADPGATIRLCLETYTEDIEIDKDLSIIGSEPPEGVFAATFLRGTGKNRVIEVHLGTTVRLESLWITGGNGGIVNDGELEMTSCAVTDNTTDDDGGGILNGRTLEMTSCFVTWNTAGHHGGGILNSGHATLTNCTISGNLADRGGGNIADGGGGIFNSGTLALFGITITDNTARDFGGGIENDSDGTMVLNDCTVSGNTTDFHGGGIFNAGTVTLEAGTTVTDNDAEDGGGIFNEGAFGQAFSGCIGGSSVSGNTPNDCRALSGGSCDGC